MTISARTVENGERRVAGAHDAGTMATPAPAATMWSTPNTVPASHKGGVLERRAAATGRADSGHDS